MKKYEYEMEILHANMERCKKDWSWISQKNNWKGYHLWHVECGQATIKTQERIYKLYKGDTFLFDLNCNYTCTHHQKDLLSVYAVHFRRVSNNEEYIRKNMCHDSICGELMKRSVEAAEKGEEENAVLWLNPVIGQFFEVKNGKMPLRPLKINALCEEVRRNPELNYSLEDLCRKTGYSKNHLIRLFEEQLGMTPIQYCQYVKLERAKTLLTYTDKSVSEIAAELGFYDGSYFSKVFKEKTGICPAKYANRIKR